MKSAYLMVIADGALTMFPVVNIKSIQMPLGGQDAEQVRLPTHVIRNARLTRGDL
jgi:hypothetical protein